MSAANTHRAQLQSQALDMVMNVIDTLHPIRPALMSGECTTGQPCKRFMVLLQINADTAPLLYNDRLSSVDS